MSRYIRSGIGNVHTAAAVPISKGTTDAFAERKTAALAHIRRIWQSLRDESQLRPGDRALAARADRLGDAHESLRGQWAKALRARSVSDQKAALERMEATYAAALAEEDKTFSSREHNAIRNFLPVRPRDDHRPAFVEHGGRRDEHSGEGIGLLRHHKWLGYAAIGVGAIGLTWMFIGRGARR